MENKKKFNAFDKVLVRGHNPKWKPDLYAYWDESIDAHQVIGFGNVLDGYILPYEGNEKLLGTSDELKEEIELKEGDWLMVCDTITDKPDEWMLRYLLWANEDKICIQSVRFAYPDPCAYNYAIRFKDFDPSNMEETKKHILCVKNGKIVKYKE